MVTTEQKEAVEELREGLVAAIREAMAILGPAGILRCLRDACVSEGQGKLSGVVQAAIDYWEGSGE